MNMKIIAIAAAAWTSFAFESAHAGCYGATVDSWSGFVAKNENSKICYYCATGGGASSYCPSGYTIETCTTADRVNSGSVACCVATDGMAWHSWKSDSECSKVQKNSPDGHGYCDLSGSGGCNECYTSATCTNTTITGCHAGYYKNGNTCSECPVGTYKNTSDTSTSCQSCTGNTCGFGGTPTTSGTGNKYTTSCYISSGTSSDTTGNFEWDKIPYES